MLNHAQENTSHTLTGRDLSRQTLKAWSKSSSWWWSRKNNCMRINALCLGLISDISERGGRNAFKSCKPLVCTEVVHWTAAAYSYCRVLGLMVISRASITDCNWWHWVLMSRCWCLFTETFKGLWCRRKGKRPQNTAWSGHKLQNTTSSKTICESNQTESWTEHRLSMYDANFQSANTIYFIFNW